MVKNRYQLMLKKKRDGPLYTDSNTTLYLGDCLEIMAEMEPDSVDAIVTDPPYSLSFMSKSWDSQGKGTEIQEFNRRWAEQAYRVLKPGGHMLVAGIGRTHHRMMCGVEDAGFEVRDCIYHAFGSGFPKSANVSKMLDKAAGAKREVTREGFTSTKDKQDVYNSGLNAGFQERQLTAPVTDAAKQWEGWGTALKPAVEVWALFRKPLSEKTVAANVLRWGTGAINVDGCRVGYKGETPNMGGRKDAKMGGVGYGFRIEGRPDTSNSAGRWPPNLVLTHHPNCEMVGERKVKSGTAYEPDGKLMERTIYGATNTLGRDVGYADPDGLETVADWVCVEGCPVAELGRQSGEAGNQWKKNYGEIDYKGKQYKGGSFGGGGYLGNSTYADSGTAARFFPQFAWEEADFWPFRYVAKAGRKERERGLDGMNAMGKAEIWGNGLNTATKLDPKLHTPEGVIARPQVRNDHPTVKPLALMRWLLTLVTPPGGLVLDPFAGSGSTLVAAKQLGIRSVGIELDEHYAEIASQRIAIQTIKD